MHIEAEDQIIHVLNLISPHIPTLISSHKKFEETFPTGSVLTLPFGYMADPTKEYHLEYTQDGVSLVRGSGRFSVIFTIQYNTGEYMNFNEVNFRSSFITLTGKDRDGCNTRLDMDGPAVFSSVLPDTDEICFNGDMQDGIEEAYFQRSVLDNLRPYDNMMLEVRTAIETSAKLPKNIKFSCDDSTVIVDEVINMIPEILF